MEYFIKASAILILFYLFYKLLLQKETFFQLNRIFLLVGLICSVLLPLIVIPIYIEVPATNFTNVDITYGMTTSTVEKSIDWIQIITFLYIGGIIIFSSKLAISSYSLLKLLFNSSNSKRSDGITYIETTNTSSPFSIFNYIVYNPKMFTEEELEQILIHEKVHVTQQHSIDIFTSEILKIIFWFNPFVWMYNKDLHQNLEYIADSTVVKKAEIVINYQHLLLKTCFPNYQYSLTNKFYNSLIKKRITMLQKNRSRKLNQWKLTLIVPVLVVFVFSFNTKTIAQTSSKEAPVEVVSAKVEKLKVKTVGKINLEPKPKPVKKEKVAKVEKNKEVVKEKARIKGIVVKKPVESKTVATEKSVVDEKPAEPQIITTQYKKFDDPKLAGTIDLKQFEKPKKKKPETTKPGDKKHGDKGKNGVIEIITKKNQDIKVIGYKLPANNNIYIGSPTKKIFDTPLENDGKYGTSDDSDSKNKTIVIRGENGEKPLMVIDGKENSIKIEDINPDDIFSINVLKNKSATDKHGDKGKNGVIEVTTKKASDLSMEKLQALVIIDGVESNINVENIDSDKIKSMNVLKDKSATDKYGDKGKNGVIEITTKEK